MNETLQKALTKDLGQLQARLEHYEAGLTTTPTDTPAHAYVLDQIKHYRAESSRVRTAILELHAAALAELRK